MKARYIRTSHKDQSSARQEAKIHKDEQPFIDIISGVVPFRERPAAKELLKAVKRSEIDYITVSSIDRLGRDAFNIQETLNDFTKGGVNVRVENLGNLESLIDGKINPIFKMITDVLANVSAMQRDSIKENQRAGIDIILNNPDLRKEKYKGRPEGTGKSDDVILVEYKTVAKELKSGLSLRKIAKLCDVSLATVQKVKGILDKEKAAD